MTAPTKITYLTPDFAVATQLRAVDFAHLGAQGFGTVVNNLPDGESGADRPDAEGAEALAQAHGLAYAHLPVTGMNVTDEENVAAFEHALGLYPGPAVAYCKSGTRSVILWAMSAVRERPVADVIRTVAKAGFDISVLEGELEARALRLADEREAARPVHRPGPVALPAV